MPAFATRITRPLLLAMLLATAGVQAQQATSKQLAPGFTARSADSRLVILPADMELFSMSAGGVVEPRDDWTRAAQRNFVAALEAQRHRLGTRVTRLEAGLRPRSLPVAWRADSLRRRALRADAASPGPPAPGVPPDPSRACPGPPRAE